MSFVKGSSRMGRELPSSGVAKKVVVKGFGIKSCQSVVRDRKRIQNPPQHWCQNVIAQYIYWEKPNPIHESVTTMGVSTHCHLR
jgi:hypothetical protein